MTVESRLTDVEEAQRLLRNANRLQDRRLSAAAPNDNQLIGWNATTKKWEPKSPSLQLARATSTLTLTTSYQSITGDGDGSKVRLLLPSIGSWLVEATFDLAQNGANSPGGLSGALFVNDSGTEETGDAIFVPAASGDRAAVGQRWKVTTTAVDVSVELKAKMSTGGGDGQALTEHTTIVASGIAGGTAIVAATDHGDLTGLGDTSDHAWALLVDGTRALTGDWDVGAFDIKHEDNKGVTLGTGDDATIQYNGTDLVISPAAVGSGDVVISGGGVEVDDNEPLRLGTVKDAEIDYDGTDLIIRPAVVGSGDVVITGGGIEVDDNENVVFGTGKDATIDYNGTNMVIDPQVVGSGNVLLNAGNLDLNGIADVLILDGDGDTTISAPTDDQIDFETAGADNMVLGSVFTGGFLAVAGTSLQGGTLIQTSLVHTGDNNQFTCVKASPVYSPSTFASTLIPIDGIASLAPDGGTTTNQCFGLRFTAAVNDDQLTDGENFTATNVFGVRVSPSVSNSFGEAVTKTVNVTNLRGISVHPSVFYFAPSGTADGDVDDYTGIYLNDANNAKVVNSVAIQIDAETAATGNIFGIYQLGVGMQNRFVSNLNIFGEDATPEATVDAVQDSTSGAQEVLRLQQDDIDDTFINFVGTSAADGSRSISSDTTENSAKFGAVRVEINGTTKWVRVYDDES